MCLPPDGGREQKRGRVVPRLPFAGERNWNHVGPPLACPDCSILFVFGAARSGTTAAAPAALLAAE